MILGISGLAGSGKSAVAEYLAQECQFTTISLADPLKRICRDVYDFTDDQLWGPSQMRNAPDRRYVRITREKCDLYFTDKIDHWHRGRPLMDGLEVSLPNYLGLTREEYAGFVETGMVHLTPRFALQQLGTEWGRGCFNDTWANMCVRTAQRLIENKLLRYDPKQGLSRLSENQEWDAAGRTIEGGRTKVVSVPDVRFRNEMQVIREAGGKILRVKRPGAGLGGAAGLHPSEAEQAGIPDADFDFVIDNVGTLEDMYVKTRLVGFDLQ